MFLNLSSENGSILTVGTPAAATDMVVGMSNWSSGRSWAGCLDSTPAPPSTAARIPSRTVNIVSPRDASCSPLLCFCANQTWRFGHVYCSYSIFWLHGTLVDVIKRYRFCKKPLIPTFAMKTWDRISSALGEPVISVEIGGVPLRAERYIFQIGGCEVPPLDSLVLACHLGGARATAGRSVGRSFDFLAGSSTVFQPGFASRWSFFGAIDMAMFHFLDPEHEQVAGLQRLLAARTKAPPFSDPLVHASAQQLLAELARSSTPNLGFVERASSLMVEQTCRVLEGRTARHVPPDAL